MNNLHELNEKFNNSEPQEILKYFYDIYGNEIILASSLSIEDQVLSDIALKVDKHFPIFTIDTGRLPEESYKLIDRTNEFYKTKISIHFPEKKEVENLSNQKGFYSFYESLENRKECCGIRKITPLKNALKNKKAWIVGLRKKQSITRSNLNIIEFDESNQLLKINPLLNWDENKVWNYIKVNNVPYSSLYNKGYTSIGCAPCTRAIKENEDIRAGRWWWENPATKECGLHLSGVTK